MNTTISFKTGRITKINGAILYPRMALDPFSYIDSITWTSTRYTGQVTNAQNMVGTYPDGYYCRLYTPNVEDEAFVCGEMTSTVGYGEMFMSALKQALHIQIIAM
jgi:hypothetical protein